MLTSDPSHLDYVSLLRESKNLDCSTCTTEQRLAILSDAAVPQLAPLLKVLFARHGIHAETYLANESVDIQVADSQSGLYEFAPDVIIFLNSLNALRLDYHREYNDREHFAERVAADMAALWDTIRGRSSAVILQNNFAAPYDRQFGNFDHMMPETFCPQVLKLNITIAEQARKRDHVLINDVAALASRVGLRHWLDERLWTVAKVFCALEHLPLVAQNIVDIVRSKLGHLVKCIAVDLDNTLWGGVIGDDGLDGIELDPFGLGEPYHRLQHYLRELRRRGIVIAVCSKNDRATAIEAFRTHPDMVLREEDIALFAVDWGPKPDSIRRIQRTLNLGLDSIVFLDDNAFERQLVRETLPQVIVPELPPDPADYVRFLSELNLFETVTFSMEDRRRADLYRENAERAELRAEFSDITEYLKSLAMQVSMRRFDSFFLPRIAQLMQRSNQFNLTTRRYSLPDCEAIMQSAGMLPFYVLLGDKLGDSGLVSVIILKDEKNALDIDSWLMSCRVLGRGVEQFGMNRVVELARGLGRECITGTYIPTAKNGMVKDFFAQFGFEQTATGEGGATLWRLLVSSYQPRETYLAERA